MKLTKDNMHFEGTVDEVVAFVKAIAKKERIVPEHYKTGKNKRTKYQLRDWTDEEEKQIVDAVASNPDAKMVDVYKLLEPKIQRTKQSIAWRWNAKLRKAIVGQ